MREDSTSLEEIRLQDVDQMTEYPAVRERHLIFPQIFEDRGHKRIIDISAGVGVTAKRIKENYDGTLICNDIAPKCLKILYDNGFPVLTYDLDTQDSSFPFPNGSFDAVISLATIEHLIHLDEHLKEINRVLSDDGYLYISSPNYAGLAHLPNYLLSGRSFHNPLVDKDRYEFYAHVRYFTFKTLVEFVSSFNFDLEMVYLAKPKGSSHFEAMKENSAIKAQLFSNAMNFMYRFFSPRWASEPVLCFRKTDSPVKPHQIKYRKKLL